jgi:hypothetical protein
MNEILDDLSNLKMDPKYRIWKPFMEKYHCDVICEIGVREGHNFERMIEHNPTVAIAVDIWKDDGITARNDIALSQRKLDKQYEDFVCRVKDNDSCRICREYSFEAVRKFQDNYFDLVYIDADHTYEGCYRDIVDWYPKVKKGGFLLGDDYRRHKTRTGVRFGVIEAVNRFAHDNNLSFFVFPRSKWGMVK